MEGYKSTVELADALGVTHQTVLNWIHTKQINPALVDRHGRSKFSDEQYNGMIKKLPLPSPKYRKEWLAEFNVEETYFEERGNNPHSNQTRIIVPSKNVAYNPSNPEEKHKISKTVATTNALLLKGLTRKTNIHDIPELSTHTQEYFKFCELEGFVPSFRSLCNWYGYSLRHMDTVLKSDTPEAQVLEMIRDTIKTNYEQAALNNKVNSIFAMFLLKSQEGYVETQKQVIEHVNPLGSPKSADEIASVIDAEFMEIDE